MSAWPASDVKSSRPGRPWWARPDDAVTGLGELADGLRVALEPAVVLRFSVLDRRVEVEPNEDARVGRQVVDGVEGGHE